MPEQKPLGTDFFSCDSGAHGGEFVLSSNRLDKATKSCSRHWWCFLGARALGFCKYECDRRGDVGDRIYRGTLVTL